MGRGVGSLNLWICKIKIGQILFEISNIKYTLAKYILYKAKKKLPIKTQILYNFNYVFKN